MPLAKSSLPAAAPWTCQAAAARRRASAGALRRCSLRPARGAAAAGLGCVRVRPGFGRACSGLPLTTAHHLVSDGLWRLLVGPPTAACCVLASRCPCSPGTPGQGVARALRTRPRCGVARRDARAGRVSTPRRATGLARDGGLGLRLIIAFCRLAPPVLVSFEAARRFTVGRRARPALEPAAARPAPRLPGRDLRHQPALARGRRGRGRALPFYATGRSRRPADRRAVRGAGGGGRGATPWRTLPGFGGAARLDDAALAARLLLAAAARLQTWCRPPRGRRRPQVPGAGALARYPAAACGRRRPIMKRLPDALLRPCSPTSAVRCCWAPRVGDAAPRVARRRRGRAWALESLRRAGGSCGRRGLCCASLHQEAGPPVNAALALPDRDGGEEQRAPCAAALGRRRLPRHGRRRRDRTAHVGLAGHARRADACVPPRRPGRAPPE